MHSSQSRDGREPVSAKINATCPGKGILRAETAAPNHSWRLEISVSGANSARCYGLSHGYVGATQEDGIDSDISWLRGGGGSPTKPVSAPRHDLLFLTKVLSTLTIPGAIHDHWSLHFRPFLAPCQQPGLHFPTTGFPSPTIPVAMPTNGLHIPDHGSPCPTNMHPFPTTGSPSPDHRVSNA
jgi:hypothetical protein